MEHNIIETAPWALKPIHPSISVHVLHHFSLVPVPAGQMERRVRVDRPSVRGVGADQLRVGLKEEPTVERSLSKSCVSFMLIVQALE